MNRIKPQMGVPPFSRLLRTLLKHPIDYYGESRYHDPYLEETI